MPALTVPSAVLGWPGCRWEEGQVAHPGAQQCGFWWRWLPVIVWLMPMARGFSEGQKNRGLLWGWGEGCGVTGVPVKQRKTDLTREHP